MGCDNNKTIEFMFAGINTYVLGPTLNHFSQCQVVTTKYQSYVSQVQEKIWAVSCEKGPDDMTHDFE